MAKYDYRAIDANGKIKKGTIEANSEEIQEITDKYIKEVDDIAKAKKEEIMSV